MATGRPQARTPGRRVVEVGARRSRVRARQAPRGVRAGHRARARSACSRSSARRGSGNRGSRRSSPTQARRQAIVVVGRCVPYGEGITFWALREIVGQLTAGDAAHRRTRGSVDRGGASGGDRRRGGSGARGDLLGDPPPLRGARPSERPLVVFFEDVHWAEPTFLDLVEYLAERTTDAPILLVCIARPELLEQRPDWTRERPNAGSLALERLPDRECEALIGNLAQDLAYGDEGPSARDRRGKPPVHRAARRHARPNGAATRPSSRSRPRSTRCSRRVWTGSGPGERAVISRAAVVGKEFSAEATVDLLPEDARAFGTRHLEALAAKEFIGRRPSDWERSKASASVTS